MKTFTRVLNNYLNVASPTFPAKFFAGRTNAAEAAQQQLIQSDRLQLRLWLCKPVANRPHELVTNDGAILYTIKRSIADDTLLAVAEPLLLAGDEPSGEMYYTGALDLHTTEIDALFAGNKLESVTAVLDIELQNADNTERQTFRRPITICRRCSTLAEPPVSAGDAFYPTKAEVLAVLAQANAAKTEAEASTTALNELIDEAHALPGPQGEQGLTGGKGDKGDPGDTVAEERLAALEAVRAPKGGVYQPMKNAANNGAGLAISHNMDMDQYTMLIDWTPDDVRAGAFDSSRSTLGIYDGKIIADEGFSHILNPSDLLVAGKRYRLAFLVDNIENKLSLWMDGTLLNTVPVPNRLPIDRVLGGIWGGYAGIGGNVTCVAYYNCILPPEKIADYFASGVAAADKSGMTGGGNWVNNRYGFTPFNTFSFAGATLTLASSVNAGCRYLIGRKLTAGTVVDFSCLASNVSGTFRFGFSTDTPYVDGTWELLAGEGTVAKNGAFNCTLRLLGPADTFFVVCLDNSNSATFAQINMRVLGAVADYRSDTVTPSGRWLDASGNANDLIPGTAAQITPLSPAVQTRCIPFAWPSTSIPADTESPVLITSAQHAHIGAIRTGDALAWTTGSVTLPSGLIVKDIRSTADGTATIIVRNLTAGALSTGAVTGAIIHTIN